MLRRAGNINGTAALSPVSLGYLSGVEAQQHRLITLRTQAWMWTSIALDRIGNVLPIHRQFASKRSENRLNGSARSVRSHLLQHQYSLIRCNICQHQREVINRRVRESTSVIRSARRDADTPASRRCVVLCETPRFLKFENFLLCWHRLHNKAVFCQCHAHLCKIRRVVHDRHYFWPLVYRRKATHFDRATGQHYASAERKGQKGEENMLECSHDLWFANGRRERDTMRPDTFIL